MPCRRAPADVSRAFGRRVLLHSLFQQCEVKEKKKAEEKKADVKEDKEDKQEEEETKKPAPPAGPLDQVEMEAAKVAEELYPEAVGKA